MKRLKILLIATLSVLTAACLLLGGCSGVADDGSVSGSDNVVSVSPSSGGSSSGGSKELVALTVSGADDVSITEGSALSLSDLAALTVTATFTEGSPMTFALSSAEGLPNGLSIDKLGEKLPVGDSTVTLSYSFNGSVKSATFTVKVLENKKLPEGTLVISELPSSAMNVTATVRQQDAVAAVSFNYGEAAFEISAYVTDETVFTDDSNVYKNDGVELRLDKVSRTKGYTAQTVSVAADAKGGCVVKRLSDGETLSDHGVAVEAIPFSLDGKTVEGYRIIINVPYSLVSADPADADIAVWFGLNNAYNSNIAQFSYDRTFGEDDENVHTYAHVKADGSVEENVFVDYSCVWGDGGTFRASQVWNVEGDDGESNVIFMTGNDYLDNNIYMSHSDKTHFYAETKLKVTEVMRTKTNVYDAYPKFGFIVKSAVSSNGFGYYVDALSNGDTGTILPNAVTLGFNTVNAGSWSGSGWSNIGTLGTSSAEYTDGYVTLGIYRQGGIFVLYRNGEVVKTVSCDIGDEEIAYVGLFSFNLKLEAKDYKLITDESALEPYSIEKKTVDYLFMGDSYIDTAFWYNWDNAFGDLSAANIGVGGTKIDYWQALNEAVANGYEPSNLIVHIGVNDIDGGKSGDAAFTALQKMFETYHGSFPDATIYYITVEHNMMFPGKWTEYDVLNQKVRALDLDYLRIIDMAALVTADENGSTQHWFGPDGLHYGVDGYALLTAEVMKALGIERQNILGSSGLGDMSVDGAPDFDYSPGWTLDNGVAHNAGKSFGRIGAESQIFVSGLYDTDFYAEVKLSVGDCYSVDDKYPKTGLAVRTEKGTYFYFINTSTETNPGRTAEGHIKYTDNYGNVFYRAESVGRNWEAELFPYFYLGAQSFDHYTDDSYTTLAVAKIGASLYFVANGEVVATLDSSLIGETERAAIAVFTFNMDVYAKDARFVTGREAAQYELLPSYAVRCADVSGATIVADKDFAKAGEEVTVTVTVENGYRVSAVTMNGEALTADADGKYGFEMPEGTALVSVTFEGRLTVDMSDESVNGLVFASDNTPLKNDVVTFTAADGWSIVKLYADGVEIVPTDGVYSLTVTEDVVITAELNFTADGIMLDGEFDGVVYGNAFSFKVEGNRDVTAYAKKGENGAWIYIVAHTDTMITDSAAWFENHDVEFSLNRGDQSFLSIDGQKLNVSRFAVTKKQLASGEQAGKWESTFEMYVQSDLIKGWSDTDDIQFNFAYNAPNEFARYEGMSNNKWNSERWWQTNIGGKGTRLVNIGQPEENPSNLFITKDGLDIRVEEPEHATIDGDLSEYEGKVSVTLGNEKAKFNFSGYGADDGLYLAITAYQVKKGVESANWWENDNFEMNLLHNGERVQIGFSIYDDFICGTYLTKGAFVREELTEGAMYDAGYRYKTTIEYFVPGAAESGKFDVGCNGNGFDGWQALVWDGNYLSYSADGVFFG